MSIGLFDSGVGGLSVWREVVRLLPGEDTIYVADQAHVPYGTRQLSEVRRLSEGITRFLLSEGAEIVVAACNTASAAALHQLRATFPETRFVGMEPAVKPAAAQSESGVIGVLATPATFQGNLFTSSVERYGGDTSVVTQVCPGLVEAVESGMLESAETRDLVRECLAPLIAAGADHLVLGCTHYPFVRRMIEEVAGSGVTVVDPSPAVARQVERVMDEVRLIDEAGAGDGGREERDGQHVFFTTGATAPFAALVERLGGLTGRERVDVRAARWRGDRLEARRAD